MAEHSRPIEAWRTGGHTAFEPPAEAAKAVTFRLHTAAVMIVGSHPSLRAPALKRRRRRKSKQKIMMLLGSQLESPMAVGLRVHHNRKVYFKSVFSGHCYFEAQALSNPLTAGMPQKTGAR